MMHTSLMNPQPHSESIVQILRIRQILTILKNHSCNFLQWHIKASISSPIMIEKLGNRFLSNAELFPQNMQRDLVLIQ